MGATMKSNPIDGASALVDLQMPEGADDTLDMALDNLLGSQEPAVAGFLLAGTSAARKMGVKTVVGYHGILLVCSSHLPSPMYLSPKLKTSIIIKQMSNGEMC